MAVNLVRTENFTGMPRASHFTAHTDFKDQHSETVASTKQRTRSRELAEACSDNSHLWLEQSVTAVAISRTWGLACFRKHVGHTHLAFWLYTMAAICRLVPGRVCLIHRTILWGRRKLTQMLIDSCPRAFSLNELRFDPKAIHCLLPSWWLLDEVEESYLFL